jgi:threonine dehydrogenase-like Zn-dependent dehydrogenase
VNAVSCKQGTLAVVERPTPTPGKGQVLIDVLRCGICGSDLHARHRCDDLADVAAEIGYDRGRCALTRR